MTECNIASASIPDVGSEPDRAVEGEAKEAKDLLERLP